MSFLFFYFCTFMWMPNLKLIFNLKWTLKSRDGTHSVSDGAATGRKSVQNDASLSNCQPPKFNSFNLTIQKSISCIQKFHSSQFMFLKKNSHGLYILIHKVHIFWEGHKILWNLHLTFDYSTYSQKLGEDFAKFCGLLRIYEL